MGHPSPGNGPRPKAVRKKALELGVLGGLAFWAANFATSLSPIAAEYRAALSISYPLMILETLLGGVIMGCCGSYSLFRLFDRIAPESPILKSVLLSLAALVLIEAFSTLFDLGYPPVDLLIGIGLNVPRFLALGLVIGYLYDRLNERVPSASRVPGRPSGS